MVSIPIDYHQDTLLEVRRFAFHRFLMLVYMSVFFDIEYGHLYSSELYFEVQSKLLSLAVSHFYLHKTQLLTSQYPLSCIIITNLLLLSSALHRFHAKIYRYRRLSVFTCSARPCPVEFVWLMQAPSTTATAPLLPLGWEPSAHIAGA